MVLTSQKNIGCRCLRPRQEACGRNELQATAEQGRWLQIPSRVDEREETRHRADSHLHGEHRHLQLRFMPLFRIQTD